MVHADAESVERRRVFDFWRIRLRPQSLFGHVGRLQGDLGNGGVLRIGRLPRRRRFNIPAFELPAGGLHYRWPDLPGPQIEQRLEFKKNVVLAFAVANPADRKIYDIPDATSRGARNF
jgi:hypothetical protein